MSSFEGAFSSTTVTPTEAEAATLTSLVSTAPLYNHSLLDILVRLFQICDQQWVSEFLFNSEMSPLSVLTAPVNVSNGVSCRVNHTNIECVNPAAPPSPHAHLLDNQTVGDLMFIPAFSTGCITVGFGIQQTSRFSRAEWGYSSESSNSSNVSFPSRMHVLEHFRFVRDDASSTMLTIMQGKSQDVIRLQLFDNMTNAERFRAYVTLRRSAFLRRLHAQVIPDLVQAAQTCVLYCMATVESRPCESCTGTWDGGSNADNYGGQSKCDCVVATQVPKHSLDFGGTLTSMRSHTGAYYGIANAHYCANGKQVLMATVASRFNVEGGADPALIQWFTKWAIADILKNAKEDPMKFVLPLAKALNGSFFANFPNQSHHPQSIEAEDNHDVLNHINMTHTTEISNGNDNMHYMDDVGDDNVECDDDVDIDDIHIMNSNAMTSSSEEHNLLKRQQKQHQTVEIGLVSPSTDEAHVADDQQKELSNQARNTKTHKDLERHRRIELRKQRNREAAQRSNLRRKLKNDTLKRELNEINAKAIELRARELALREENLRLRSKLKKSKSNNVGPVVVK